MNADHVSRMSARSNCESEDSDIEGSDSETEEVVVLSSDLSDDEEGI